MTEMKKEPSVDASEGKLVKKGSIKKKIESFRRWSSASIKRPPKPKAKTLSLSSPDCDPGDLWLPEGHKRKLRPIVDSVFGQINWIKPLNQPASCLSCPAGSPQSESRTFITQSLFQDFTVKCAPPLNH